MEFLFDEKIRLGLLLGWLFILCATEFAIPLVTSKRKSVFKTLPNLTMMALLLVTNLIFSSVTFFTTEFSASQGFGLINWLNINNSFLIIIVGIVLLDFWAAYLPHVLFHKVPLFWRFHSVHHSDTMVDVTTAFRQHPAETLLRLFFQLSGVLLLGLPLWALLVYRSLSAFNAQLEHSNIRIFSSNVDKFLQHCYVTPNMHKVHHSKYQRETDSNYGNLFSIWDRLFGTFQRKKVYEEIDYGLDYIDQMEFGIKDLLIGVPLTKPTKQ